MIDGSQASANVSGRAHDHEGRGVPVRRPLARGEFNDDGLVRVYVRVVTTRTDGIGGVNLYRYTTKDRRTIT